MILNPMLVKFIGSFVRWAATVVFAWLTLKGIITAEDSQSYISALTDGTTIIWFIGTMGPLAWSIREKYKSAIKLNTALATEPMSQAHLDSVIKLIGAASAVTSRKDMPVVVSNKEF